MTDGSATGWPLVQPVLPIIAREPDSLVVLHIDVDRDAGDSRLGGHKHEPASFILHEIQKIVLTIHFKLQFLFSLVTKTCSGGGGGSELTLSEVEGTRPTQFFLLKADG